MRRSQWLALGAVMAALATAPAAAEDAGRTPTPRSAAAKKQAAKAKRNPPAATVSAAPEPYQLVPTRPAGSALVRARQNAFGTRDEEASSSGARSRHIGIGLGGGNGMTPGMAIGF